MPSIFAYDYHCNDQGVKLKLHGVCTVVLNWYVCIPNIGLKTFHFFLYLIIIIVVLVIYYYYDYYYLIIIKDALMDNHRLENIQLLLLSSMAQKASLCPSVWLSWILLIIIRVELIYKLRNSSYCYFEISVTINIFSIERPVGLFWIKCLFQLMKWDISGFVSAFEKKRNIYIYNIRRVILGKSCIPLYHWYNVFDVCDRWLMFFFSLPDLKSSLIVMSKESGHLVRFFCITFN